jgi:hypothetical protein
MTKKSAPKKQETKKKKRKRKKPDDDEPISLYPLTLEEALKKVMDVPWSPPEKDEKTSKIDNRSSDDGEN